MKRPILLPSLLSVLGLLAPDAHAVIDTNTNGLSDLWEKTNNNGSLYSETYDPQADPDQDGWTNAQEAAAGTDPNNPNPPDGLLRPDITHVPAVMGEENGQPVVITPETVVISWVTTPGKQYTLLYSPDLSANSWLPVDEPFIGTGFIREFGFPNADANRLFLRVAISDADSDNDGLTDAEEHTLGTNSLLADSDGDGSNDFDEIANATLPLVRDTDEDGVLDGDEASTGTDPLLAEDLDDDNMPDDWEKFMSTSLLEIFPDPAHWGVRHAHLVNQDLEPAQSYTSDGLTAIDVCNVMVNTEDAGNGEGLQFEWQEREENFIGVHNSESDSPYSGTGHSSSPEWSRNFSTSEYGDSSGLTSAALLTRQSALSWAPVAVRNPSIGDYKPLFTAFPYELYEPERIGTLGIHAHCNYYTYSISDTASGMNGRKKSFRVRLASRKPVAEAVAANWLRVEYSGGYNNAIDPLLIQDVDAEEAKIYQGGMLSDWVTVDAELPAASQGAGDGKNSALFSIKIEPDANMAGVIGDVVKSANQGSVVKHFVTPKKSQELNQDYVVLKATGITADQITAGNASQIAEWEGGEAVPNEPLKRRVKRDSTGTGPTEVKIKAKSSGNVATQMNVWVVWCDSKPIGTIQPKAPVVNNPQIGPITTVSGGLQFTHTIEPAGIVTTEPERPDLKGVKVADPPGAKHPLFNSDLKDGAANKWDASRQFRFKHSNPNNLPSHAFSQPAPIITVADFPSNPVEGNDDAGVSDEVPMPGGQASGAANDPYQQTSKGILWSTDVPSFSISKGNLGDTYLYNLQLQEFARLEIGKKWYRISDHIPWRFRASMRRVHHAQLNIDYWAPDPQQQNPVVIQSNLNDF